MRQETSMLNKVLAFALCMFVMLSSMNLSMITYATEEATDYKTVTEAELVADNYESLTDGEKAILKSGLLKSRTLTYPVPSGNSDLVSVNAETRHISVSAFEKDGFVWNPVYASVVYSEDTEIVKLTDGEGTFKYDGTAYSVEAYFELHIPIAEDTQAKLLNAPFNAARLFENGEVIDGNQGNFNAISGNIDSLVKLYDGSLALQISNEDTIAAISDLKAQTEENDDFFVIEVMLYDYDAAESKLEYLVNNGSALKSEVNKIYTQIETIYNDAAIVDIIDMLGSSNSTARKLSTVRKSLKALLDNLAPAVEDDWAMLDSNPLKDGMTAEDYQTLDELAASAANAEFHDDEILEKLFADTAVVRYNVNQHIVTVVVSAEVIKETSVNSAVPTALESHSAELRLLDGTSAEKVIEAINESTVEQMALEAWIEISEEFYDRVADEITGVLSGDLTYNIKYTPKQFNVEYNFETELPATVPYGYNMLLPLHEGEELVYDYTANGQSFLQGEIVRITGNTLINRSEGKPWNVQTINKLVAVNFADDLSAAQLDVLNSVALKSEYLRLREPDNSDNLIAVSVITDSGDGTDAETPTYKYQVVAKNYASGLNGISWKAVSGRAILGTDEVTAEFTFADGKATFTSVQFDRVEVEYKIDLADAVTEQQILDAYNLPRDLAEQAADQKENLEIINGLYSKLGQLNRAKLNQIKFGVGGSEMSEEAKASVDAILNGCVDNDAAELYLYIYLTEYRKSGLAYYYQDGNYQRIRKQVEILNANLATIYNDPAFLPLLQDIEYEEYYERIADIIADLSRVTLSDPHEAINTASPSLAELVAAIERVGEVEELTTTSRQFVLVKTLDAAAPQRAVVTVNVKAVNSNGEVIKQGSAALAFSTLEPLTDADIEAINGQIDALVASLGIDAAHYETSDTLALAAGQTLAGDETVTVTFGPKEYTVTFYDEYGLAITTTTFKFDVPTITLPACEENGKAYSYNVCGEEIIVGSEAKSFTFTAKQIDGEEYKDIARKVVDIYRNNTLDLVEEINNGAAEAGLLDGKNISVAFIPLEDENGNLILVLRLSPKNISKVYDYIKNTAEAITASDFTHIELDGDFLRENDLLSAQAFINAVLNSGMSIDTLLDAVNEDGTINEMTLPGATVINSESGNIYLNNGKKIPHTELLGGKLMETMLKLGVSENDTGISVKLYVTVEDFGKSTNRMKDVRDLAKKAKSYGNVTAHDGMLDIELRMPDRAYQAYISAMVALGNTTLHDLDEVDLLPLKDLVLETVKFIVGDEEITTTTFENTLAKVHKTVELSKYEQYYSKARKVVNHVLDNITIDPDTETATSNSYTGDVNYDLQALFDKLNLAETFRAKIKENETGVNVRVKVTLNNRNDYEALVLDHSAKGTAKVVYTRDLAESLRSAHKNTAIILLGDYDGDVTIKKQAMLDLNGHKINGNLVCDARTLVIDSSLATDSGAGVTGTVSGNAIITAGEYGSDVSSMLKTGYKYEDGKVKNLYYYIEVVPSRGGDEVINVHFTPDGGTIKDQNKAGLKAIGAELVTDFAFNYYMCAALTVGGNELYTAQFDDVLRFIEGVHADDVNEALDFINCEGVTALVNDFIDKLTGDLTAVGEAMLAGEAVATYEVNYKPWTFELEHVTAGDYLTANVGPNEDIEKSQTINFYIDDNDGIGDLLVKLGEILTIDAEVELEDVYYDSKTRNAVVIGNGSVDATADLTGDPNYAIVIGVVLANGTKDEAKREALVEAIKTYYETGYVMSDLKAAVEKMTTQELLDSFDTNTSFDDMVSALGLDDIIDEGAAELFDTYIRLIKITFKVINRLHFSGSSTKLGKFEKDYGVYSSEKNDKKVKRSFEVSGEYGVTVQATAETIKLTVKLFTEDVPFPIIVLDENGDRVWQGFDLNEAFDQALDGYTIVVLDEVELAEDVELDREVKLEGGEFVDFGESVIILTDPDNSKFIIDIEALDYVESGVEDYSVAEEQDDEDNYVYTLEEDLKYKIIVYSAEDEVLYMGDDLNEAFAAATAGSTIYVLDEVELTADVELDRDVKLEGGEFVDFGEYKIILTDAENSKLTIDVQITDTVVPQGDPYFVNEDTDDDDNYVYTLGMYKIIVTNGDEVLYKGDDLNEAFAAATAGSTITIYGDVALTADVELDRDVKVVGADYADFGSYSIILTSKEAKLTIDKQITSTVKSGSEYSEVSEENENNDFVYTLTPYAPVINNPTIDKQDPTLAYKIDNTRGIIILDVLDPASLEDLKLAGNGITTAQFKAQLGFTFEHAETTEIKITAKDAELGDGDLVPTGTLVTVTAQNPDYDGTVTKEYDVVIIGDTNCNGRIDSGDAKLMLDHYMGIAELTGLRFIAGDTNCNGRIESGDAVKNTIKYIRPKDYKSDLE